MKRANFIYIEDEGVDLILSFALEDETLAVRSLILMRTPKFESLMPDKERGVRVSLEGQTTDEEDDMLIRAALSFENIEITTQSAIYTIDLSKVDDEALRCVYPFLQKMNFDKKFAISNS